MNMFEGVFEGGKKQRAEQEAEVRAIETAVQTLERLYEDLGEEISTPSQLARTIASASGKKEALEANLHMYRFSLAALGRKDLEKSAREVIGRTQRALKKAERELQRLRSSS